jgi:hypothetical protein
MFNWIRNKFKSKVAGCKSKRPGFTGLEVITHLEGKEKTRCLFTADMQHCIDHRYIIPIRISESEILTGFAIEIHRESLTRASLTRSFKPF